MSLDTAKTSLDRCHIILDGLQDPQLGQQLSAKWNHAGYRNVVDVAGQCAWLLPSHGESDSQEGKDCPISEVDFGSHGVL